MNWLKRIVGLLVVIGLAAFAGLRIRDAYQEKSAKAAGPKGKGGSRIVSVSVDRARTGSVKEELMITGALRPKEQVDVTAKATGRVEKLIFQVGDTIKKGDLIAELEDDEISQQVRRSEAAVEVAGASLAQRQAELNNARADLGRAETLLKEGLIPRQDFEGRQTAYRVVQAQVQLARAQQEQARAEVNELKIRLEQTRIYSPMDGYIAKRYVDEGALLNPNTPILNVVNLATMVTMANVPERDIAKLRVGSLATIQVDAFGDRRFSGRVARIAPILDAATRSATLEVEIPNPKGELKGEMFARVILNLESSRDAVLIPREALVYRGQQPGVYVLESQKPVFRTIETGQTMGSDVEVLANLQAGTTVIARGASMLTEGDEVRVAGGGGGGGKGKMNAAE